MEDTKFLVIPNINGVAMPAIKMTCDLKTPYLQRASKKLNIGDKVLVVHVADSASFDDPAILANGGAKLVFIGTFCTVEDIVEEPEDNDEFEISEIYEEENPDGIIDKLFHTAAEESKAAEPQEELEHKVDPDEFALYKKYL